VHPLATINPGLGGYAQAVETAPVATLTLTGATVGLLWGVLLGFATAKLFVKDQATYSAIGGASGALILGLEGYRQGMELNKWLAQY
jgi:uncharacterized membrane protein